MREAERMGSEAVSGLFYIPEQTGQSSGKAAAAARNGIFIGSELIHSMPLFLDFDLLMNPHLFILGMSGGGKTFLMRSLLLKMHAALGSIMVVIDFTGEYGIASELQTEAERSVLDPISYIGEEGYRVLYFNLRELGEHEKVKAAGGILGEVVRVMRSRPLGSDTRIFVLLDEAWKLLRDNAGLRMIIREGRKYKVGLILASQLVEDMELPMLASSAALFIFRIQNRKSLEKLSRNYGLSERTVATVQNLETGSCLAVQVYKTGMREALVLRRVMGVALKRYVGIAIGEIMVEIDEEELGAVIRRLCEKDPSALIAEISASRAIGLRALIAGLMRFGAERKAILGSMRELGIGDYEISDAFAFAMEEAGE